MKRYILGLGMFVLMTPLVLAQNNPPTTMQICTLENSKSIPPQCYPMTPVIPGPICTLSAEKSIPPQCQPIINPLPY